MRWKAFWFLNNEDNSATSNQDTSNHLYKFLIQRSAPECKPLKSFEQAHTYLSGLLSSEPVKLLFNTKCQKNINNIKASDK